MFVRKSLKISIFSVAIAITCLQVSAMQEHQIKIDCEKRVEQEERKYNHPLLTQEEHERKYDVHDWTHAITCLKKVDVDVLDNVSDVKWEWQGCNVNFCCPGKSIDWYSVNWNDGSSVHRSRKMPVYLYEPYEKGEIQLEGLFHGDPVFSCYGDFFVVQEDENAIQELKDGITQDQIDLLNTLEHHIHYNQSVFIHSSAESLFNSVPLHARVNLSKACVFEKRISCCDLISWSCRHTEGGRKLRGLGIYCAILVAVITPSVILSQILK